MTIDILIGSDYYWQNITNEIVHGKKRPTAVYTRLGWVLSGPTGTDCELSSTNIVTTHNLRCDSQPRVQEGLDATLRMCPGIQSDEKSVLEISTRRLSSGMVDTRYWKEPHRNHPDNYHLSRNQLRGLLSRLKQNPSILKDYDATVVFGVSSSSTQR